MSGESKIPSPSGANEQYDLLFRSYLNSQERAESLGLELLESVRKVREVATRIGMPSGVSSRFPGGSLIHRILRRVIRRHTVTSMDASRDAIRDLANAVEQLATVWSNMYRHEFEIERRTRAGLVDRLAIVDAMQVQLELLRSGENDSTR